MRRRLLLNAKIMSTLPNLRRRGYVWKRNITRLRAVGFSRRRLMRW